MQLNNTYMEDFYNNKENEKINNEVFNINPKLKYPKTTKTNPFNNYNILDADFDNNYNRNERNEEIRRESSLKLRVPNVDKQFRDRRAKSISFSDISMLSNQKNDLYERNKYYVKGNYKMGSINNQKKSNNITRNRSYSSSNGNTILARKKSFRKPKILISSKEHIRRLKKMKSSSAISFENDYEEYKPIKRRYSIHSSPSLNTFSYDDDFYGDRFDESYSDLPPNNLYNELKQAHEKELLQRKLENKSSNLEVVDEDTIYYDSDGTINNSNVGNDENNGSLLSLILKYLENSINKENDDSIKNTTDRDIKENLSVSILEREIKEEDFDDSFHSGSSQFLDEDSELHKQEELLESMFNDVIKSFYGYQTKFCYIIIKLISFLLYNGGKMNLGSQVSKYILRDKFGISLSSNDESSLSSTDTNNINHLENEEMEFVTLRDIKENRKHEKRRKKGYKSLNKFWIMIHNIFIFLFLYIFLIQYHSDIVNKPSYISNLRNANISKDNKIYNGYDNKNSLYESDQNIIWNQATPVTWITSNNDNHLFINQCHIDKFTENRIITYNIDSRKYNNLENKQKITNILEKFTPWKSLIILECILFSAQFGFQYLIMDEVVPFFKPASYTSVLFINQIINFFIQYKIVWKILYNDLCLYLFIIGIYIMIFS